MSGESPKKTGRGYARNLDAGQFQPMIDSWDLLLRAGKKSAKTNRTYLEAAQWFAAEYLQRLKGQGLWRLRVEGKAGLSEERVDEVGPALDVPEPGADHCFDVVQRAGGVVAQAALHR